MKEIREIIKAYESIDFSTTRAVLATVARVEGSSYRRTGARMLVLDDGTYLGGISGGCLEGDALRRAQQSIFQDKVSLVTYDTTQDDGHQIGVGLGCKGIIDVLFTPLYPSDEENPVRRLATLTETRVPAILVSITGAGLPLSSLGKAIVYENDEQFRAAFPVATITEDVLRDLKKCLARHTSCTVQYDPENLAVKVFIEVIMPVIRLVLFGSNYDIYTMVRTSRELGWDVTVVASMAKIDRSLLSIATKLVDNKRGIMPPTDYYTAVVLMAHDYKTDFDNLQKILPTQTSYIGMLGPRKRTIKMFDVLTGEGSPVSDTDMQRIFSPAGLDIGAATPEEIALSIAAEIRGHFAGRQGMPLRNRQGTIYEN